MKDDSGLLNLKPCASCGSTHIDEDYDAVTFEYFIRCASCGHTSERTYVQNDAEIHWNSELGGEERDLIDELKEAKEELASLNRQMEDLEDQTAECVIYCLEKRMKELGMEVPA